MKKGKEIYKLWWEYLKRSDDYKEFCEWMRKKRINNKIPVPDKFKKDSKGNAPKELINFLTFHDIHAFSFDEWWEIHKERLDYKKTYHNLLKPIEDYANFIEGDFDDCIESFKRYEGREPSLKEFKKYFCQLLKQRSSMFSYFMVTITEDKSVLKNEFNKIISSQRKKPYVKSSISIKRNSYPRRDEKHIRIDELKKYLDVYDLRQQKLKPKEIIKRINSNDDPDDLDIQRAYRDHFQKAKKIIKFVERGIFPGWYDETSLNRKKRNAKKL